MEGGRGGEKRWREKGPREDGREGERWGER